MLNYQHYNQNYALCYACDHLNGGACFLIGWLVLLSVTSDGGWGGSGGLLLHRPAHTAFHQAGDLGGGGTCWRRRLGDESLDYATGPVHSENEKRGLSQHTPGHLLIILLITCDVVVGDFFQAGPDWWALRWDITRAGKIDQTTKHTYY